MLPYVAMACVVLVDAATWRETSLLPLFAIGPALAAAGGGRRRVLVAGAVAVVLCALTALGHEHLWRARFAVAAAAILCVTAAAYYVATARERTERRLRDAETVANTMQQLLREPLPATTGAYELAASYVSAADAARVGGDVYDAVAVPHGVRLMVADVQGKGLPAVRVASVVLSAFRESAPYLESLPGIGERIGQALERRTDGERFVTCVIAEACGDGAVEVLNYGHPPPLIRRRDGTVEFVDPPTHRPPLGLGSLTGTDTETGTGADSPPARATSRLAPGDRLLLYTDGLSEARDDAGAFYPLRTRAAPLLDAPPHDALHRLREDIADHVGGPVTDDSALLLAVRRPHPPPA